MVNQFNEQDAANESATSSSIIGNLVVNNNNDNNDVNNHNGLNKGAVGAGAGAEQSSSPARKANHPAAAFLKKKAALQKMAEAVLSGSANATRHKGIDDDDDDDDYLDQKQLLASSSNNKNSKNKNKNNNNNHSARRERCRSPLKDTNKKLVSTAASLFLDRGRSRDKSSQLNHHHNGRPQTQQRSKSVPRQRMMGGMIRNITNKATRGNNGDLKDSNPAVKGFQAMADTEEILAEFDDDLQDEEDNSRQPSLPHRQNKTRPEPQRPALNEDSTSRSTSTSGSQQQAQRQEQQQSRMARNPSHPDQHRRRRSKSAGGSKQGRAHRNKGSGGGPSNRVMVALDVNEPAVTALVKASLLMDPTTSTSTTVGAPTSPGGRNGVIRHHNKKKNSHHHPTNDGSESTVSSSSSKARRIQARIKVSGDGGGTTPRNADVFGVGAASTLVSAIRTGVAAANNAPQDMTTSSTMSPKSSSSSSKQRVPKQQGIISEATTLLPDTSAELMAPSDDLIAQNTVPESMEHSPTLSMNPQHHQDEMQDQRHDQHNDHSMIDDKQQDDEEEEEKEEEGSENAEENPYLQLDWSVIARHEEERQEKQRQRELQRRRERQTSGEDKDDEEEEESRDETQEDPNTLSATGNKSATQKLSRAAVAAVGSLAKTPKFLFGRSNSEKRLVVPTINHSKKSIKNKEKTTDMEDDPENKDEDTTTEDGTTLDTLNAHDSPKPTQSKHASIPLSFPSPPKSPDSRSHNNNCNNQQQHEEQSGTTPTKSNKRGEERRNPWKEKKTIRDDDGDDDGNIEEEQLRSTKDEVEPEVLPASEEEEQEMDVAELLTVCMVSNNKHDSQRNEQMLLSESSLDLSDAKDLLVINPINDPTDVLPDPAEEDLQEENEDHTESEAVTTTNGEGDPETPPLSNRKKLISATEDGTIFTKPSQQGSPRRSGWGTTRFFSGPSAEQEGACSLKAKDEKVPLPMDNDTTNDNEENSQDRQEQQQNDNKGDDNDSKTGMTGRRRSLLHIGWAGVGGVNKTPVTMSKPMQLLLGDDDDDTDEDDEEHRRNQLSSTQRSHDEDRVESSTVNASFDCRQQEQLQRGDADRNENNESLQQTGKGNRAGRKSKDSSQQDKLKYDTKAKDSMQEEQSQDSDIRPAAKDSSGLRRRSLLNGGWGHSSVDPANDKQNMDLAECERGAGPSTSNTIDGSSIPGSDDAHLGEDDATTRSNDGSLTPITSSKKSSTSKKISGSWKKIRRAFGVRNNKNNNEGGKKDRDFQPDDDQICAAVVLMQAWWRGRRVCTQYENHRMAALRVQAWYRGIQHERRERQILADEQREQERHRQRHTRKPKKSDLDEKQHSPRTKKGAAHRKKHHRKALEANTETPADHYHNHTNTNTPTENMVSRRISLPERTTEVVLLPYQDSTHQEQDAVEEDVPRLRRRMSETGADRRNKGSSSPKKPNGKKSKSRKSGVIALAVAT